MATLPTSLALTTIADGSTIVAADHRNNYSAVQTEANALLTILGAGTAGDVFTGVGTTVQYAKPPGYKYDYTEDATSPKTTTSTTAATATTIITSGSVTFDGATQVQFDFYCCEAFHSVANNVVIFELWDGATDTGILTRAISPLTNQGPAVKVSRVLTPSAAAHTYTVRMWVAVAGTGTVQSGAGSPGGDTPMSLKISKV